jgi:hypothetical protein
MEGEIVRFRIINTLINLNKKTGARQNYSTCLVRFVKSRAFHPQVYTNYENPASIIKWKKEDDSEAAVRGIAARSRSHP